MLVKIKQEQISPVKIWFSDEAYFSLDSHLNKQNYRFWGRQRFNIYAIKNLSPQKILVWAAISYCGIEGPYFIGSTVTAESYDDLLKEALPRRAVTEYG